MNRNLIDFAIKILLDFWRNFNRIIIDFAIKILLDFWQNSDRILIMIKLNGGNDGLNTLIPVQDQIYYDLRPNLSLRTNDCLPLTYDTKLHPSMKNTKTLFDQGLASAAHGVGYPSGNLSHFRSSDIWVTGSGSKKIWASGTVMICVFSVSETTVSWGTYPT